MKKLIKTILLTILILIALYRLTSYSQTATISETTQGQQIEKDRKFELYQNEPENFAELTLIKFDIYKESDVDLSIFDSEQRMISNLVSEKMQPGHYSIFYKATKELAPGNYTYKIQAGEETQVKKMVLLGK